LDGIRMVGPQPYAVFDARLREMFGVKKLVCRRRT
jgi:hypothetical protein